MTGGRSWGPFEIKISALRVGGAGIVTNRFELHLDYGLRIKARGPAPQTFTAQLAAFIIGRHLPDSGVGWCLSTERALQGGGCWAMLAAVCVGPEGSHELVKASLAELNELFGSC